jgi:signal transduction histidine kinase/ActR/RegA family two-component response regulator
MVMVRKYILPLAIVCLLGLCFIQSSAAKTLTSISASGISVELTEDQPNYQLTVKSPADDSGLDASKAEIFTLESPSRLIVDIPVKKNLKPLSKKLEHNIFSAVRVGSHPGKIRIVVDIKNTEKVTHSVNPEAKKGTLQITFTIGQIPIKETLKPEEAKPPLSEEAPEHSEEINEVKTEQPSVKETKELQPPIEKESVSASKPEKGEVFEVEQPKTAAPPVKTETVETEEQPAEPAAAKADQPAKDATKAADEEAEPAEDSDNAVNSVLTEKEIAEDIAMYVTKDFVLPDTANQANQNRLKEDRAVNPDSKDSPSAQTVQKSEAAPEAKSIVKLKFSTIVMIAAFILAFLMASILFTLKTGKTIEQLQQSLSEELEAAKTRSEALATINHEVRNPMNGIIGMTDLLLKTDLTEQQREYLEMVQSSAQDLLLVMKDIIDLLQIDEDKDGLEEIPFNIKDRLSNILKLCELRANKNYFQLLISLSEVPSVEVVGNPGLLHQLIVNLLDNMISSVPNTEKLLFEARTDLINQGSEMELHFAISSSGTGIPEETQDQIADAFLQGLNKEEFGPGGLDLSSTIQIVNMMKGRIWLEKRENKSAVIFFTINLKVPQEKILLETAPVDTEEEASAAEKDPADSLNILIAEDDQMNQIVLTRLLEKEGHKVTVADDGIEVVTFSENQSFDLILMDIQMPVLNGFDATELIRQREQESGQHIPIIAVTGLALEEVDEKYKKTGIDAFVEKPIDENNLFSLIRTLTEGKQEDLTQ